MRLISTFAALTLLSVSMPAGSGVDDGAGNDSARQAITIVSTSPEWTRRVEWGLERFRDAGLALPAMAITVHDDDAPCDGNSGLYLPNDPVEVHLCVPGPVDSRPARLTTLHELAHAWAESQLSAAERAAFLELRGLDVWYDQRVPRHQRGMEHAAEVVSWGLMDEMIPIIRIYDAEPAQLSEAFDLLVDRPPLWTETRTTADRTLAHPDRSAAPPTLLPAPAADALAGSRRTAPTPSTPKG
jgi:hypothetical protein